MDRAEFLKTGLLQQYAFGLTTKKESRLVEQYMAKYPDLADRLHQMRAGIDQYAKDMDMPPNEGRRIRHHWWENLPISLILVSVGMIILLLVGAYQYRNGLRRSHHSALPVAQDVEADQSLEKYHVLGEMKDSNLVTENFSKWSVQDVFEDNATARRELTYMDDKVALSIFHNPKVQRTLVEVKKCDLPPSDLEYQIWTSGLKDDRMLASFRKLENHLIEVPYADADDWMITLGPVPLSANRASASTTYEK